MSSTPPRYRLVIFDAIDDPKELRDLISNATGAHPTDAVQWLAKAPGVWPKELDEAAIRTLLDGLYEFGVAAEAWRIDQFPDLSPPRTIHRAACLDDGLRIEGLRGEPTHWVPWDRVEMICAGCVAADAGRARGTPFWPSTVVSGLRAIALRKPRPFAVGGRSQRTPRDPVGEVLVVRRDPRIVFRFVENQMNYAYLGDRLKESAADNFPIFLADLCARSAQAFLTDSTRALLERRECGENDFPSSQAILEHATLQLLWSWYRRDRDSRNRSLLEDPTDPDVATDVDAESP
ncbi:hypothetical protein [Paludisphaera borealis]|uniref:Uncharacterized protein n=1 Tax=Paludisphaera borealis TaxID=1387353 RepID=A0A1U7CQ86_9BACT|nr:hypothetical protein [Paludisphaera borealis]APW61066.1 hypothetical protein BSF38_02569 [Paludisphaera borealis]